MGIDDRRYGHLNMREIRVTKVIFSPVSYSAFVLLLKGCWCRLY